MSHTGLSGFSDLASPAGIARRSDPSGRSSQPDRSTGRDPARPGAGSCPGSSTLRGLSDRELLSRVRDLVSRERTVTLEVLVHLIEVERRRLHVDLGYASMFDYCTRHLRYSSSAAARRIQTARCIRDYPEVYGLVEKNEVNLSTVSLVSSILTPDNHEDILHRIRNKSQKETEGIVADYRPPVSLRDRARPVCVAVPAVRAAAGLPLGGTMHPSSAVGPDQSAGAVARSLDGSSESSAPGKPLGASASGVPSSLGREALSSQRTSTSEYSRCGSEKRPNSDDGAPRIERKFHVQFLAGERFMKKLEKAKALLSSKRGNLSYEVVLESALDEFLKDHDPEERDKRRETRREKAEAGTKSANRAAEKTSGNRSKCEIGSAGCGSAEGPPRSSVKAGCGRVDGPLFRRAGDPPTSRVAVQGEASRRIPPAVRDAVFARDKGRCTYVGPNGARCTATHHLEIDHLVPFARGGTHTLGNLRLLCERHNKREAERVYGPGIVKKFRARE